MFRLVSAVASITGALSVAVETDAEPCFCGAPPDSALVVIDMQNDFLPPNGPLAVPKGDLIVPKINELAELSWSAPVAYTEDYHPHDHISFASSHEGKAPFDLNPPKLEYVTPNGGAMLCNDTTMDYASKYGAAVMADCTGQTVQTFEQAMWPDHCVQNTEGAAIHKDITKPSKSFRLNKGYTTVVDSYSALNNALGTESTNLHQILEGYGVKKMFIVGVAQDFCVHFTAKDAVARGYEAYIVDDATEPVNLPGVDADYAAAKLRAQTMNKAEAKLITSAQLNCGCSPTPAPVPTTTDNSRVRNVNDVGAATFAVGSLAAAYAVTSR